MPTENRSSNTEMVSVPFQREDRYIVVKRRDLALLSPVDFDLAHSYLEGVLSLMDEWNCPAREYLVLESDWPESAPAWAAIERRVTGSPAQQFHPDPIAWMVGTAFWWTKVEAERDAVETGLPIVGLGPMAGAVLAEQHQGEPVTLPARKDPTQGWAVPGGVAKADGWNACLDEIAKLGPLYTHPGLDAWQKGRDGMRSERDAAIEERDTLRRERRKMDQALSACANERDALRTQVDKLEAMLRKVAGYNWANVDPEERARTRAELRDMLSASAEPSEERGSSHGFEQSPNTCRHDERSGVWWKEGNVTRTGQECHACGNVQEDPVASAEPSAPNECAICRDLGNQCMECEEGEFREWADRPFAAADYRKTDAGVFIQDWMRHAYGAWCARGVLTSKQ
ncbi:DUF3450 domain-containing protein [Pseudomonas sp. SWI7]|uniref:DUF3450 domain-containing protein n=1 Tax=Pseudomonas sp. SWI7 TaxID=2587597 RepID=UPI00111DFE54|nr:DUF3450 domain-containing protein [Pseudomonas sp. SWI7]QDC04738.1 DUF3450 domain-containing protein [Pseudomonas sp. SWI7]